MTIDAIKTPIVHALAAAPNANQLADAIVQAAIRMTGRMKEVTFNREWATDTLTTGQSSYELGAEIFTAMKSIVALEDFRRTDVENWPIHLLVPHEFSIYKRGSTQTGPPRVATVIDSENPKLEIAPIPDSGYAVGAYLKRAVGTLKEIPDRFHDLVLTNGLGLAQACKDPNVAILLAHQSRKDAQSESPLNWTGTTFAIDRHLGRTYTDDVATSWNLRP